MMRKSGAIAVLLCIFSFVSTVGLQRFVANAVVFEASAFQGIDPVRIVDTRESARPTRNTVNLFDVVGLAGIPGNATSVVLNVTAVQPDAEGFITVFPAGLPLPNTSNVNMQDRKSIVPNLVTTEIGEGGKIAVYTSVATNYLIDVFGYYSPASQATSGRFIPRTPERLLDTRNTERVPEGGTVRVSLPSGVPADSEGMVFNVTSVDSSVRKDGYAYWTAFPAGGEIPNTSNLNVVREGQTIANQVIVKPSEDGVDFYSYAGGNLIVDFMGFYTGPSAPLTDVGLYVSVIPTRLLDTRSSPNPLGIGVAVHDGWNVEVPTGGVADIPVGGASAVAVNVTLTRALDSGFVTVFPAGQTRPNSSNINSDRAGTTAPNHVQVQNGERGISLYSYGGGDLIVDVFGWFVGSPAVSTIPKTVNRMPTPQAFPGRLAIPEIKLDTLVRENVGLVDLDPSHLQSSSTPNQPGNVAIFGHRTSHGKEFRKLDKLKVGSSIYLTVDGKTYIYRATSIDIRTPEDPMLYSTNSNAQTISLVACHPPGSVKFRIVVHGELVAVVQL